MRRTIVELMRVESSDRDESWLDDALQNAVDLELSTLPIYLSGMWSIKDPSSEVYSLVQSVVLEEMLHMGLTCNMLRGIGGTPAITPPTYPSRGLPGGVRPDLCVYLAGLTPTSVQMYMQIELPEHPLALTADTYPTIGAFYDAVLAAFQALDPPISTDGQLNADFDVPNPDNPGNPISETLAPVASLSDVETAIATIKDQGEGTSTSPDAPEFGGELAHYYRFGEIYYGHKLVQGSDGTWTWTGDPVPFPDCYPVAEVPMGGYPTVPQAQKFDALYTKLIDGLRAAWSTGGQNALNGAIGTMFQLGRAAAPLIQTPIPDGTGNYGPDFVYLTAAATEAEPAAAEPEGVPR